MRFTGMNSPLKVHDYDFSLKFLVSFDCHRARTHICSSIQIPKLLLMKNQISNFGSLVTMLIPILCEWARVLTEDLVTNRDDVYFITPQ